MNCSPSSRDRPSERGANQTNISANKRQEIFNFVCDNICNWRDLGRCLGTSDAELNRISQDLRLSNDIKLFTYRILERAETAFGNQFYENVRNALINARRKDLAREMMNILQRPI